MAATSASLSLAPAVYFERYDLHQRYCWWYQVLVQKILRLCVNSQTRFQAKSEPARAVERSLEQWKEAFKAQVSQEWVALLDEQQLDDIYQELYRLARYLLALNALRPQRKVVASISVAIEETVSTLMHPSAPSEYAG